MVEKIIESIYYCIKRCNIIICRRRRVTNVFNHPLTQFDLFIFIIVFLIEVMSEAKGPTESSEYEHSSIPATIKKLFNLSSNFLTHRDAWAATFEDVVSHLTSPRTDCPMTLPEVAPMRATEPKEDAALSEFQGEVVQLAAVLNGDHFLSSFPDEVGKKMTVKQAHEYVKGATSRFIRASKEAMKLGADKSAIVDMRSSLTTRPRNL